MLNEFEQSKSNLLIEMKNVIMPCTMRSSCGSAIGVANLFSCFVFFRLFGFFFLILSIV